MGVLVGGGLSLWLSDSSRSSLGFMGIAAVWVVPVIVLYAVRRSVGVGNVFSGCSRNFPGVLVFRKGCRLNPLSAVISSTSVWDRDQSSDSLYRVLWDSSASRCCAVFGPGLMSSTLALAKWPSLVRALSHKSLGICTYSSFICFFFCCLLYSAC